MADVSFTPTFRHTDYVDNRDRVQAGGPNGFNARFRSIQTDFESLSDVVTDVDAALDALGTPTPTERTLTLSPALVPVVNRSAWVHNAAGYASRSGPATDLGGLQSVPVPHGARLVALRVLGQNSGSGALRIGLMRSRLLTSERAAEPIASIQTDGNPFDARDPASAARADVDTTTFRYFLLVTLSGAASGDTVLLSGFQIVYLA